MQPLSLLKPPVLKRAVANLGLAEWSTGEDRVSWLCGVFGKLRKNPRDYHVEDRDDDAEEVAEVMKDPRN